MESRKGAEAQYTVLRIKRKATEAPLSSLVIQDPSNRIKKRRDVSGKPRGIFRLAETVPPTWEGKGDEGEALKTRIKGLMQSEREEENENEAGPSKRRAEGDPAESSAGKQEPGGATRVYEEASRMTDPSPAARASSTTQTQYKVIPPMSPRSRLMLPPKVYSHKDVETGRLVFVDAQAVEAAQAHAQAQARTGRSVLPPASNEDDKEMAAFQSMLQEYLSLEKPDPPTSHVHDQPDGGVDDGYVYDLYYRDLRASPSKLGVGDGVTPASIGALLGYEDFSPPSTPSDSELEDEADEDSNEEDFYRNDYPEDEDADSDMQDLEQRDELWSDDEGGGSDDGEGGGVWDYR